MSHLQVRSPIHLYNLFKSCVIIFVIQAVLVLLTPIPITEITRFVILILNLIIAIVLGWRLYKYRYHLVFTYDNEGFSLKKGEREEVKHKWRDFSQVSLFRAEYGELAVRLYANEDFVDLPVSKLRLNPFDFRLEAMKLVSAKVEK